MLKAYSGLLTPSKYKTVTSNTEKEIAFKEKWRSLNGHKFIQLIPLITNFLSIIARKLDLWTFNDLKKKNGVYFLFSHLFLTTFDSFVGIEFLQVQSDLFPSNQLTKINSKTNGNDMIKLRCKFLKRIFWRWKKKKNSRNVKFLLNYLLIKWQNAQYLIPNYTQQIID